MDNSTWIATIAGLALGIGIVVVLYVFVKKTDDVAGMTYSYDDLNRLKSIEPMNRSVVKLTPYQG